MTDQLLFNRKIRVTIATPIKGDFAAVSTNVVEIENLRVQFKVDKGLGKEPNQCEVVVTNLSPERRAQVQTRGGKFILQAGYESGIRQLFIGDIRTLDHLRDGPNWHTKISSGDGERAFRFARVNESFKGGVTVGDVVNVLASALGLGLGNVPLVVDQLSAQYVNGFSAFGSASRELTRVLSGQKLSWSVQDGELLILRDNEDTGRMIPDLSPSSGLIGSPEFGAAEKNKGPVVKFKSLLDGRIKPGGRVKLNSLRYTGEVRVTKLSHSGDTAGGDWYTACEGEPLGGV
jgi:hypothetical protein